MNLVLDDAEEIHSKTKSRKQLGMSGCLCNLRGARHLVARAFHVVEVPNFKVPDFKVPNMGRVLSLKYEQTLARSRFLLFLELVVLLNVQENLPLPETNFCLSNVCNNVWTALQFFCSRGGWRGPVKLLPATSNAGGPEQF